MFFGLGENAQYEITFKNGSVVNGAGRNDGTSYWDLTPETRVLSDMEGGGNTNLGWNAMKNATDYLTLNIESGSKYASKELNLAHNDANNCNVGTITVNISGTNMGDGYTEVAINGGINLCLSRFDNDYGYEDPETGEWIDTNGYSENVFVKGFAKVEATSLNMGKLKHDGNEGGLGGLNQFIISGESNYVAIQGDVNIRGDLGYGGIVRIGMDETTKNSVFGANAVNQTSDKNNIVEFSFLGEGNTIYTQNDFNMANNTYGFDAEDGSVSLEVIGSATNRNFFDVNRFAMSIDGRQDNAMFGSITAYFENADIRLRNSELLLQGSTLEDSELTQSMTLAGNTKFRGATVIGEDGNEVERGVWLKVHEWDNKAYSTVSDFIVKGANNDVLLSGLELGSGNTENEGVGRFVIQGGGSQILMKNIKDIDGNSDSHGGLRLRKGGELAYVFDSTGISTLKNGTWNNDNGSNGFESTLVVDLTDAADCLVAGENRFELLVTSDMVLQDRMKNWFSDLSDWDNLIVNEDFVDLKICGEDDTYRFALENVTDVDLGESQALVLYYTYAVPEPATYAAIFGALAIAFGLMRRRSK